MTGVDPERDGPVGSETNCLAERKRSRVHSWASPGQISGGYPGSRDAVLCGSRTVGTTTPRFSRLSTVSRFSRPFDQAVSLSETGPYRVTRLQITAVAFLPGRFPTRMIGPAVRRRTPNWNGTGRRQCRHPCGCRTETSLSGATVVPLSDGVMSRADQVKMIQISCSIFATVSGFRTPGLSCGTISRSVPYPRRGAAGRYLRRFDPRMRVKWAGLRKTTS